ncbi:hypothetical protein [Roseibium salinum]|uniref:1,4-alpha-glucan branching enzyme n=1 Tax=Roseibium salinum TaxID=1604349 RepID=A0ABT3QVW2_9HYPH|nr:hypothetical protein [Roseibium sp. DSM 29163]MCX2721010.1 hypothetical protein [Roseibium sp. DSM 29163]MDN3722461.1 hypothetical protein [Roseibium salinum]
MSSAVSTTNHETIRKWVEDRGGHPAKVKGSQEGGILRIDFGEPEEGLEEIGWDEFFRIFEENGLAFLHQDETDAGGTSRFNKFIERG